MESPTEVPVPDHKTSESYNIAVKEFSVTDPDKRDQDADIEVLPSAPLDSDDFPDCGFRAWAVVFGAFCTFFSTLGYITSWGIFQVYYQQHFAPNNILQFDINSWIGSIQRCMIFLPGVLVGRIFDIGYFRVPFATGSILIIVGTFLLPVCKVFWHFILCQGFMIGIGFGLTYGPSATVVTHWWKRRRGLVGIAGSGSAAGGIVFPFVMRQLVGNLGFTWTCRILGFFLITTLGIANLCLTRRLPPCKAQGGLFGLPVFQNTAFACYSLSYILLTLGAFTVPTYLPNSAILAGLSQNFAFYLVAIHNAGSLVGALVFGFYGDLLGAMNVLIQTSICLGIITVTWPFCHTLASLTVISLLYGLVTGSFTALGPVPGAAMGGTEDLGRRIGTVTTILGLGSLCGPPLGGLLTSASLGYQAVGYLAGGLVLLSGAVLALARFLAVRGLWSKF